VKLLFVHGFLGSAPNWGPIINKLRADPRCEGWELQAVDLLAHGRRGREPVPRPLTLEAIAADLDNLFSGDDWIGVGHSFGLRPLLRLAQRNPARFTRIVAEDSSPLLSDAGYSSLAKIFDEVPAPFPSREEARASLNVSFGIDTALSRFLLSNIRELAPGVHNWRFDRDALRELLWESRSCPLWPEWRSFAGPIHMILGAQGSYVPEDRLGECLESRPAPLRTDVVRIEGAGHWVHSDRPVEFVEQLVRMITS
jgi:pimeloyl-ACP methyl ester carboxylesterase